jgi:hypothetical protein
MARPTAILVASAAYFAGLAALFAGVLLSVRDGGAPAPWIAVGVALIVVGVVAGARGGGDPPRR